MAKAIVVSKKLLRQAQSAALRRQAKCVMAGRTANEVAGAIKATKDPFLSSPAWRAMRRRVIAEYGGKCMKCKCTPFDPRKINVDHIKPRKYFPHLALDFGNLQVLCARCNKDKGNTSQADYRPS